MEKAKYMKSYIEQRINYSIYMNHIPMIDYLKIIPELDDICICGQNITNLSTRKQKTHIRRCVNMLISEIEEKDKGGKQEVLLENTRREMEKELIVYNQKLNIFI